VIAAVGLAAVAAFAVAFGWLGVVRAASGAIAISQHTMGVMRNPALDDRAREQAMQQASIRLLGSCVSILLRSALAVLVSMVPIWLFSVLGLVTIADVFAFLSRWDVIALITVAMAVGYVIWVRWWPSS
jgi:hypothetical protein